GKLGGGDRRDRGRSDEARRRQDAEELQCPLLPTSIRLAERRTRSTDTTQEDPSHPEVRPLDPASRGIARGSAHSVCSPPLETRACPGFAYECASRAARLAVGRGWGW